MDTLTLILGIGIGGACGALMVWLSRRGNSDANMIRTEESLRAAQRQAADLKNELESERGQHAEAERNLATIAEREKGTQQRLAEQKTIIEEMRKQLLDTFEASSRKALQDNSERFIQQAAERMKPLREQLEKQERLVAEMTKERQKGFGEIGETLKQVLDSHRSLSAETNKLTTALRRPDQRGRWGEVQLRRVVELAGMVEHCDFSEQTTLRDDDTAQRPDMVINLPNGGRIAVDSKVPLDAYLDAIEDADERKARRAEHCKALEARWKELARKSYWDSLEGSPELVVMFIPIESALMAAMELKPTMHADALADRVLIATPMLLVALLQSIAHGWRQEQLAADAQRIAEAGRELYKRLQKFSGLHAKVGSRLESAVRAYNESVGSFESRLLKSSERLRELGVAGDALESPIHITTAPRLISSDGETTDHDDGSSDIS